jgi:hypothetical protein
MMFYFGGRVTEGYHEHISVLNFEGKAISSVNSVDKKRTSRTCLFMSSGYIHA